MSALASFMEFQADKEEAREIRKQGALQAEESRIEADRIRGIRGKETSAAKLQFLKQGVRLSGTPSDVLAESEVFAKEEADAIQGRGESQFQLARKKSKIQTKRGRAKFFSSLTKAGTQAATAGAS